MSDAKDERTISLAYRAAHDPREVFDHPLSVVERTDLSYLFRLSLLQRWLALVAKEGAGARYRDEIVGAILSLEAGLELRCDEPGEVPGVTSYGGVLPTNQRLTRRTKRPGQSETFQSEDVPPARGQARRRR